MDTLGSIIRKLRKGSNLPLRVVADLLELDQAVLSKIERGQRNITRDQVIKLADYFKVNREDLIVPWLSDKIMYIINEEESGQKALLMAEENVAYQIFKKTDRKAILSQIKKIIKTFPGIHKAWIYGSFARGDDKPDSDVDIAIKTDDSFSYFDLAEIHHTIEQKVNRKVDIGFIDSFKPYIRKQVEPDLKLVYERFSS
jgi:predicted nucleotidyltransferase/plasmid maintenance system antidote protein VapI